jgi:hypothetical protein
MPPGPPPVIIYDFSCDAGHRFEGWFGSAADCDGQLERGLVACPHCDSARVAKVPSAAHVHTGGGEMPAPPARGSGAHPSLAAERAAAMQRLRQWVASAEDVGERFAQEARRIHEREAPERAIRGVASADEARALQEDGIPVVSLPAHLVDKSH